MRYAAAVDRVPLVLPSTLQQSVLAELRHMLAVGRFGPGEALRIDRIAAELGVSPIPVREAFRVLLADGLVRYEPYHGYSMAELTLADVEENVLLCGLFETEALRRGIPLMDDAGRGRMLELLQQLDDAQDADQRFHRVALHQEFHFVPIGFARLPLLESELRRLWQYGDRYRALLHSGDRAQRALRREHRAFADACGRGRADLAIDLVAAHRKHELEAIGDALLAQHARPRQTMTAAT